MNDTQASELAMWDVRCNDLQNSLDRVREERDELRAANEKLFAGYTETLNEVAHLRSLVSRIQVAMSQGQEL